MKHIFYTCDVFTQSRFGGNQLAVFPDASSIPENALQPIAREFNFSETTFVYPPTDLRNTRKVRIFTPGGELPFAGHPTIGTAVVLASIGSVPTVQGKAGMIFEENVGPVPVSVVMNGANAPFAQLTAAKLPEFNEIVPSADRLAAMLSLSRNDLDIERFPVQYVSVGFPFLYVAVKNRSILGQIRIHQSIMKEVDVNEVFVFTADPERRDFHFRARMFAPLLGIAEDPATGSAAASFAAYLAEKDPYHNGTVRWNIEQGFEMGRPSLLYVEADKKEGRISSISVGGNVVLVTEGTMELEE